MSWQLDAGWQLFEIHSCVLFRRIVVGFCCSIIVGVLALSAALLSVAMANKIPWEQQMRFKEEDVRRMVATEIAMRLKKTSRQPRQAFNPSGDVKWPRDTLLLWRQSVLQ